MQAGRVIQRQDLESGNDAPSTSVAVAVTATVFVSPASFIYVAYTFSLVQFLCVRHFQSSCQEVPATLRVATTECRHGERVAGNNRVLEGLVLGCILSKG